MARLEDDSSEQRRFLVSFGLVAAGLLCLCGFWLQLEKIRPFPVGPLPTQAFVGEPQATQAISAPQGEFIITEAGGYTWYCVKISPTYPRAILALMAANIPDHLEDPPYLHVFSAQDGSELTAGSYTLDELDYTRAQSLPELNLVHLGEFVCADDKPA